MDGQDHTITTTEALESLYSDAPYGPAVIKETDHVTAEYRKLIEAAPFVVLATNGPEGLDCSPRGDPPGFVRVVDEHTLLIPDRRGNNRIDSLRNLVRDPRIALLFLIPGVGETMRIIGRAKLSTDPKLDRNLRHQRQAAEMRAGRYGRESLLPVHQGDHPLETLGPGEQGRPQNLADAGLDPRRIDRRQDGRPRARPPGARAHQRNDLLSGRRFAGANVERAAVLARPAAR